MRSEMIRVSEVIAIKNRSYSSSFQIQIMLRHCTFDLFNDWLYERGLHALFEFIETSDNCDELSRLILHIHSSSITNERIYIENPMDSLEDSFIIIINKCMSDSYWKEKKAKEFLNNIYGIPKKEAFDPSYFDFGKEYCVNDVKMTVEAYKKLKEEENMPPKSSFYPFTTTVPDYYSTQEFKDKKRHQEACSMELVLGIKDVKYQDPATIVFWDDGTKTVVKCQKGDKFDPEKGLAMAIVKKKCGHNEGYFNRIFQKWVPDEETLMIDFLDKTIAKETKRPTVFTETAEEYKEEVKKLKKIGDGYDDIRWETNGRIIRK